MLKEIKKILIIKLRAIGDVLLSTPVIENLRTTFEKAQLDFLVENEAKEVVIKNPYVDRIIAFERKKIQSLPKLKAFRRNLDFIKEIRTQRYDLVIDLFGNPRSALLTLLSGAEYRVGYNFRVRKYAYNIRTDSRGDRVHEVEFNLDALRRIGVPVKSKNLYFPIDSLDQKFADRFFAKEGLDHGFVIGINSSGGWPAKRWKLEHFAALADRLVRSYQARILLLWGPSELEEVRKLRNLMNEKSYLAPESTLGRLGALLQRCDLVISNDSGPMHIAAALGVPTVGIFGPTDFRLQGPYGEKHEVAVKLGLPCLGCNKLTCSSSDCMNLLSPDDVFQVVKRCIEKNKQYYCKKLPVL